MHYTLIHNFLIIGYIISVGDPKTVKIVLTICVPAQVFPKIFAPRTTLFTNFNTLIEPFLHSLLTDEFLCTFFLIFVNFPEAVTFTYISVLRFQPDTMIFIGSLSLIDRKFDIFIISKILFVAISLLNTYRVRGKPASPKVR